MYFCSNPIYLANTCSSFIGRNCSTSAVHTSTTDHVVSSQPAVPIPPYILDQSNMPTLVTMCPQAIIPTRSQQMGFSPFSGTFPHFIVKPKKLQGNSQRILSKS